MRLSEAVKASLFVALLLPLACTDDGGGETSTTDMADENCTSAGDENGTETGTGTTTDEGCQPGTFGCACIDGTTCDEGFECFEGTCELPSSGDTTTTTTTGGNPGSCGWNARAGYYDCGFAEADPGGTHPIECPDVELMNGSDCPEGLSFEGCCEGAVVWFCEGSTMSIDCAGG